MNTLYIIIAAAGGLVAGFVVAWLVGRTRIAALSTELEMTKAAFVENLKILDTARESFQALSSEALKTSKEDFLQLAKLELEKLQAEARGDLEKRQDAVANLVKPIRDSLEKVDSNIRQMEISREGAYRDLLTNVRQLADAHVRLEGQTTKLATALRNPQVGGLWGQSRKVSVMMSGDSFRTSSSICPTTSVSSWMPRSRHKPTSRPSKPTRRKSEKPASQLFWVTSRVISTP